MQSRFASGSVFLQLNSTVISLMIEYPYESVAEHGRIWQPEYRLHALWLRGLIVFHIALGL